MVMIKNERRAGRVVTTQDGNRVRLAPGEERDLDLSTDAIAELGDGFTVSGQVAQDGPDYQRDGLGDKPLADASKNELMVIAAYEQADAPEGEKHTKAELIKAIEAKRKG